MQFLLSVRMKTDLHLSQLVLVCLLYICALVDIGQGQRSAAPPILISRDIQATVAVLTVIGAILVCIVAGVIVYCICRPWSNRRREGTRYVHSEHDRMI